VEIPREEPPDHGAWLSQEASDEIETRHTFLILLRSLPAAQREVMAWTYDGYRPTEIAALLGKPPATVRSLLRDARAALVNRHRANEESP
jgi:DNA-directed RNA polymerase specialized sigma24 family protein